MACVKKRRGKWVLDYRDQQGRRHWETTDLNKRDAELLLAQRLQEIGRNEYQAPAEQTTFEELVDAFRDGHIKVVVRDTTADWYEQTIRNYLLPYFRGRKIRTINAQDIERFRQSLVEKGKGPRTINRSLVLLGGMFRYALKHRWVTYNPVALVRKVREEHGAKRDAIDSNILTPAEINAMIAAADERYRALLMAAVLLGLRQGELLGLQWGDISIGTASRSTCAAHGAPGGSTIPRRNTLPRPAPHLREPADRQPGGTEVHPAPARAQLDQDHVRRLRAPDAERLERRGGPARKLRVQRGSSSKW